MESMAPPHKEASTEPLIKFYENLNFVDNELVHGKSRKSHLDPDKLV